MIPLCLKLRAFEICRKRHPTMHWRAEGWFYPEISGACSIADFESTVELARRFAVIVDQRFQNSERERGLITMPQLSLESTFANRTPWHAHYQSRRLKIGRVLNDLGIKLRVTRGLSNLRQRILIYWTPKDFDSFDWLRYLGEAKAFEQWSIVQLGSYGHAPPLIPWADGDDRMFEVPPRRGGSVHFDMEPSFHGFDEDYRSGHERAAMIRVAEEHADRLIGAERSETQSLSEGPDKGTVTDHAIVSRSKKKSAPQIRTIERSSESGPTTPQGQKEQT